VLDHLTVAALNLLAQVPDPGAGKKPPGADKFLTILQWCAWVAFGVCVLGVIVAGASMAVQHRHGSGGEHAARLGWVAAGCVVVGSASALVGALV
jgi:type IV secretory pathway VirB2 component (pilin)